jgi:hypothetical protein
MSTKASFLVGIVSSVCLVAISTLSLLHAQTDQASRTPLSFYGLGSGQEIRFTVYTNYPPASFGVEVSAQPPQAKIRLLMNSSIQIVAAEKIWGHPAGETVTRSLTPADLQTLETFLAAHRAKGAVQAPALSGQPAMAFTRITYRTNEQGHLHADPDRKEFYPVSEQAQRDFIKNFIGFKG